MKQGLYTEIREPEYNEIDALRSSDLKLLLRSPGHYKAEKDGFGPTPSAQKLHAWAVGDAFHAAVLEPDRFKKDFILMPEFSGKGSRTAKAEWVEEHQEQTSLTKEDYHTINNMRVSVLNHPEARQLLEEDGLAELTGCFVEPEYQVPCKIRVDRLNKLRGIPIDLKTSGVDARPNSWQRRSYDLGYNMQGGFYCHGLTQITAIDHTTFIVIVVEKEYPHGVMVYEMNEDLLLFGMVDVMEAIRIYRDCLDKDEWPCYPTGIHTLGLPKWAKPSREAFYG